MRHVLIIEQMIALVCLTVQKSIHLFHGFVTRSNRCRTNDIFSFLKSTLFKSFTFDENVSLSNEKMNTLKTYVNVIEKEQRMSSDTKREKPFC